MKTLLYIVTWCLSLLTWENVNTYDKYGRYDGSYYESVIKEDCNHRFVFDDIDSAYQFMKELDSIGAVDIKVDSSVFEWIKPNQP